MRPRDAGARRVLPGSPFKQAQAVAPIVNYSVDDRVNHDRYGLGTVVGTEDGGMAVLVDFGSHVQRVTLPSTKLVKL